MSTLEAVAGRLALRPGAATSVQCERPLVGPALLGRLTRGRRAAVLPELLGSWFTLCAPAQRLTSRRAIAAALRPAVGDVAADHDRQGVVLHTAAEHLQRIALDWPRLLSGQTAAAAAPSWLRAAPVFALPPRGDPAADAAGRAAVAALPRWLEQQLFGMSAAHWLAAWQHDGGDWLAGWSQTSAHPVAGVLRELRPQATAVAWHCRALDIVDEGDAGWRALGAAIGADPHFCEQPQWRGAPAETGPWTRGGRLQPVHSAWDRLGARLADLAQIAAGLPLAGGALHLGPHTGLAWSEMSRGLLVHWVRLDGDDPATACAQRYHVLAPTEWNFHPDGRFAQWLASRHHGRVDARAARLAAVALDPCVAFTIEPQEVPDA